MRKKILIGFVLILLLALVVFVIKLDGSLFKGFLGSGEFIEIRENAPLVERGSFIDDIGVFEEEPFDEQNPFYKDPFGRSDIGEFIDDYGDLGRVVVGGKLPDLLVTEVVSTQSEGSTDFVDLKITYQNVGDYQVDQPFVIGVGISSAAGALIYNRVEILATDIKYDNVDYSLYIVEPAYYNLQPGQSEEIVLQKFKFPTENHQLIESTTTVIIDPGLFIAESDEANNIYSVSNDPELWTDYCEKYQGYGEYRLYICDVVEWNGNNKFVVTNVTKNVLVVDMTLVKGGETFNFKDTFLGRKSGYLSDEVTNDYNYKFMAEFGENYMYKTYYPHYDPPYNNLNVSLTSATLEISKTCKNFYDMCVADGGVDCELYCNYTDIKDISKNFVVLEEDNVAIVINKKYEDWGKVLARNGQNCVNAVTKMLGVEKPVYKIAFKYFNLGSGQSGCSMGSGSGILCYVGDGISSSDLDVLKYKVYDDGMCLDGISAWNGTTSFAHEMTHVLTFAEFPELGNFLSEGIASYVEMKFGGRQYACGDKGYNAGGLSGPYLEYKKLAADQYGTGACFVEGLEKKYGNSKFKQIFGNAAKLKIGKYSLFKDLINPIVGEDAFKVFKDTFKIDSDPVYMLKSEHY